MAIEQNISIAVDIEKVSNEKIETVSENKLNFNQINLSNTNQDLYQNHSFNDTNSLTNLTKPEWYHYVICAYKGILEEFEKESCCFLDQKIVEKILSSHKLNLLITGNIPHSAGLSSSSALVVASSIVFRYCLGLILNDKSNFNENLVLDLNQEILKIKKDQMASNCAYFERFIGTQGGGIDQAIQLLAENGTAKLIKFKPKLNASNVELPKDCEFFILHCGRTLNKASTIHYNVRVFETRVAAAFLLSKNENSIQKHDKVLLSDFETSDQENPYYDLIKQLTDLFKETKGRFTMNEIQELLQVDSIESLSEKIHFPLKTLNLILEKNGDQFKFNLLDRALHVYNEYNRVQKLQAIDSNLDNEVKINLIGNLLNESHQSLKVLYECSCDELDKLVDLSNLNGAKGAKLTGAGWAGCLVSIVPKEKVEEYENELSEHCKFMIKTKPDQGALIYYPI